MLEAKGFVTISFLLHKSFATVPYATGASLLQRKRTLHRPTFRTVFQFLALSEMSRRARFCGGL